jgi:steroid delta-isomerase-like uncharacterized protein
VPAVAAEVSSAPADAAPDPEALVRRYFAAVAARDPDAMARHWSPDGVEDIVAVGIFRGPEEVRGFFSELFGAMPDAETVVEQVVSDGSTVVVRWRMAGTFSGGPMMGLEPTDRRVELRGCDVLEVADGLIQRNTAYYDGMAMARGVGMLPAQQSGAEKALFAAFNAVTKVRSAVRERVPR